MRLPSWDAFLFWAFRVVSFPVAFSGFANDTA
jgi:hypothetical protein